MAPKSVLDGPPGRLKIGFLGVFRLAGTSLGRLARPRGRLASDNRWDTENGLSSCFHRSRGTAQGRSEGCWIPENSKKKDDLSDCYLQALTYLSFKQPTLTKTHKLSKKEFKEFLDKSVKECSVMEIMETSFKSIHELEFPFELSDTLEKLCNRWSMKKYLKYRYYLIKN